MALKDCKKDNFGILLNVEPSLARQLTKAAKACGESRAAFIRRACLAALRGIRSVK